MAKKRVTKKKVKELINTHPVGISKLTNLFLGITLGLLIGYGGGKLNVTFAIIAIIITIILAVIYKNEK
jgi:hypothetical protein